MPDGAVWVTDSGVHKLTLYSAEGLRLRSWDIPVSNTMDSSHLAAASDGAVYMTEPESKTLVTMDGDGTDARTYAIGEVDGSAVKPVGVAADSMGNVWVTDVEGGRVLRIRLDSGDANGK